MKKIVLVILFVSSVIAITFLNVKQREDSTSVDLKFQDVEAFGEDESGGGPDPYCTLVGGICSYYENDQLIIRPGLHF